MIEATELYTLLDELIDKYREAKPGDRSELDRYMAIVLTDLEKVKAYHTQYVENELNRKQRGL